MDQVLDFLGACDGVRGLEEAAARAHAAGVPAHVLVVAARNLTGGSDDLDGGVFAAAVASRLAAAPQFERRMLAELVLLPKGTTVHQIVELTRAPLPQVEQSALMLLRSELIAWTIEGVRLRRPATSLLMRGDALAPELTAAVDERVARHALQDAIQPTLVGEDSWFELAEAIERVPLPSTTLWRALRLLFDTNGSESHVEKLRHLAASPSEEPAFVLLRACLQRNAGDLDVALDLTARLLDHPTLSGDARLEHARTLFLAGRLEASAEVLRETAPLLDPLAASDALRCLALIALAGDRPNEARELNRRALQTARGARLRVAEARCNLQLAALESADLNYEFALEHALRAKHTFGQIGDLQDLDLARIGLAQVFIHLRRSGDAEAELQAARDRLTAHRFRYLRSTAEALLGLARLDKGDLAGARSALEQALASVDEGQPRTHALVGGIYALLLLLEGHRTQGLDRLERSVAALKAAGDLLQARLFDYFAVDAPHSGAAAAPATGVLRELHTPPTSDARSVWARLLRLTRQPEVRGKVLRSGEAFQLWGEASVSLSRRAPLRRLVAGLAAAHGARRALDTAQLFELGWPGERSQAKNADARVYVAISELKKLGLREHLGRAGEGYALLGLAVVDTLDETGA